MKYIFKSTLKQKLLSATAAHPRFTMLGIGMILTIAIGTVIGMLENGHITFEAFAQGCKHCNGDIASQSISQSS